MDNFDSEPFIPLADTVKRMGWLITANRATFAMVGAAITRPEALETARRVWPMAEVNHG
jgi:hypothetical protein